MQNLTRHIPGAAAIAVLGSLFLCPPASRAADEQPAPGAPAPAAPSVTSTTTTIPVPSGLTVDDVKVVVVETVFGRKLKVLDQSDGKLVCYYARKNVSLALTITWQADQVTMEVKEWDPREKGRKQQEFWLTNVRNDIVTGLAKQRALK